MPFDPTPMETDDKMRVYRERREAAAALWRRVPNEGFDMKTWHCGSKACALGWLAHERHDGWNWDRLRGVPIAPDGFSTFYSAADYFGITVEQALVCFGSAPSTADFHGRLSVGRITPADVAASLLHLPYTTDPKLAEVAQAIARCGAL